MLSQLKSNAFATQKQCFPTLEDMLSSKGIHAFWARKPCFRKVEEKWKIKSSLPPHVTPLYKGVSEEKVEVEEKFIEYLYGCLVVFHEDYLIIWIFDPENVGTRRAA